MARINNQRKRRTKKLPSARRAQFFTIDALIALTIIIITILTISPILKQPRQESTLASDILQTLDSITIAEFDNAYAKQLISDGKITNPSKSLLEQIGEFYVTNITIAKALATEALSTIPQNENIGIWYGSTLLSSRNITPFETAENIFTDRQSISGIGGNGSVTGFSTRAFLSSSSRTAYAYFGGYIGEGNITILIDYQGTVESSNIEVVVSDDFEIIINENSLGTFTGSPNDYTPVNYSLNTTYFTSGTNSIQIKGHNLHIAGGFVRIKYDSDVTYEQPTRYYFPGIQGLINLYDGFHIPGNLTGLSISLHFNNSIETFLTLGKTQVFNASSSGTSSITIPNATLASLLNFSDLSEKTIPIRFGMDDMNYVTNNSQDIDVFSATDISGSMRASCEGEDSSCCDTFNCDVSQNLCESCGGTLSSYWGWTWCSGEDPSCCEAYLCSSNETSCTTCGGTSEDKIQDAKDANELFIDMILNETENQVGLTAYSDYALDSNYHALSNDTASLKAEVVSWTEGGATCICCGINKAVQGLITDSNSTRFRSIVMMSDGDANRQCSEQDTGDANNDAIQAACDAYEDYGIKVYTIGFGSGANVATLTSMAACADGSFYSAIDDLEDIYEKIAEELIETAYYEQTVEVSGEFFSELFSDSYIEFEYEKSPLLTGLLATIEQPFTDSENASFSLPLNSTLIEASAISYSGPKWTALLNVNNQSVYNLSEYQTDFLKLGDPYSVNIPIHSTSQNNNLTLKAGLAADNISEGSIYNKIIYTISKDLASYTSVSATATGCNWTVQFSTYNLTLPIPEDYSGTETCEYSSSSHCGIYSDCQGATDSTQIATYNLFKLLDFDLDGKLDVDLSAEDMQITTSNLEGVPFLFSTEVQIRKWY